MKKLLLLLIVTFLLTGCHAVANIDIEKDKITENITVTADSDKEYSKVKNWSGFPLTLYYDQDLENPFGDSRERESGVEYYSEKFDDSTKTLVSNATFNLGNHTRSSLVRGCFNLYNVGEDENDSNIVAFATSEGITCDFSNFDVVISTPYEVVSNNADSVDSVNNIYTWSVKDSNKNNTSISIVIDFSKRFNEKTTVNSNEDNSKNEIENEQNNDSAILVYIIIIIIVVLIVILLLILKKKKDKSSEL